LASIARGDRSVMDGGAGNGVAIQPVRVERTCADDRGPLVARAPRECRQRSPDVRGAMKGPPPPMPGPTQAQLLDTMR
jgi:hypothetical protein